MPVVWEDDIPELRDHADRLSSLHPLVGHENEGTSIGFPSSHIAEPWEC